MSETPRIAVDQEHHRFPAAGPEPLFLGPEAPPLEGEERCICGQLEGEHLTDGTCPGSGCEYFVAESDFEEPTNPEIRVEYEPGLEPAGVVR
jgi:hypothetical protein